MQVLILYAGIYANMFHRATIYFRDDLNTSPLVGALGFAFFSLAMAVGRLYTDKLGEIYSRSTLLRCGGGLAAAGLGLSVLAPAIAMVSDMAVIVLAVIGFTISGRSWHFLPCIFKYSLSFSK